MQSFGAFVQIVCNQPGFPKISQNAFKKSEQIYQK